MRRRVVVVVVVYGALEGRCLVVLRVELGG